ncbi:glycosyltransferase [Alistipes sp. OttesenSCG-928-B03]|nr:glycosyltransferase [Alistipes sp. OttesenSCG-928-B03]
MKVSLLIPVYGVEDYIERCVRSLFGQTYRDIEYVFVDDASPDGSIGVMQRVLEEYPERREQVKVITNPQNLGLAGARNVAFDHSTGDYVLCMDSDDYLETDAVELLVHKAQAESADMVVFDWWVVGRGRPRRGESVMPTGGGEEYVKALLLRRSGVSVVMKMVRRSVMADNAIRWIAGLNYGEDYYVSPLLAYHSRKTVRLDRPLYWYVHRGTSISANISPAKAGDIVRATDELTRFFSSVPEAAEYRSALVMMKAVNKVLLLQEGDRETVKYAAGLYGDVDFRRMALSLREKTLLRLADRRCFAGVRLVRRMAATLKRMKG